MRAHTLLAPCAIALALWMTPASARTAAPSAGATATAHAPVAPSRFVMPATVVDGIAVTELSGLAWDADEQLLYAVSDQGYVYHFRIRRDGAAIVAIKPVFAARLTDPKTGAGTTRSGRHFNAEGLALRHGDNGVRGDSELVVALEENPPQIARFNPAGALLGRMPVPAPANDIAHYQKKNRGLESVALHPAFGLMTAPEAPLRTRPADLHTLYASGGDWSFPGYAADSRLKGLDVLSNGDMLVLERSRASKHVKVASLRRVDVASCRSAGNCSTHLLATLPPAAENFEGMTLLDAHHALLVSDAAQGATFALVALP